jgi:hypothetical protein
MQCASSMTSIPTAALRRGRTVGAEAVVVQPLGRDEQHVHRTGRQLVLDLAPRVDVRRVDRASRDAHAGGGCDLVPHEGEQRGDDERGPGAGVAEQAGGDPVHG